MKKVWEFNKRPVRSPQEGDSHEGCHCQRNEGNDGPDVLRPRRGRAGRRRAPSSTLDRF